MVTPTLPRVVCAAARAKPLLGDLGFRAYQIRSLGCVAFRVQGVWVLRV